MANATTHDQETRKERDVLHCAILESAIDYAIIAADRDGLVTVWNEGARRILGWEEHEMLGRSIAIFFTDEDRAASIPQLEMNKALADGAAMDERWHQRKDGGRFWANGRMTPLRTQTGDTIGFLKILTDLTSRRQAEDALRIADERLQLAREAAGVTSAWSWDIPSDKIYANARCAELFSVDPNEAASGMQAARFFAGIHPADREWVMAEIAETIASGGICEEEFRLPRNDGSTCWIFVRDQRHLDDQGEVLRFAGIAAEITDRKQAEEALRKADASRGLALRISDLGCWDHDWTDGGRTYDARARAIMGFNMSGEIGPGEATAAIHPLDRDRITASIRRAVDPKRTGPYDEEYRIQRRDTGEERWVSVNGRSFFENGKCVRFAGVIADITDRKRSETALRESEAFTRLLLDSTEEGFYSVDRKGVTTLCNAAFLRMLGFKRMEDAVGKKLHVIIHHSHPDGSHYAVEDCPIFSSAQTGEPATVQDELFFRLDGTSFPVEYRVRPVLRSGELQGAICTFVDITERKRTERELKSSREALQIANATLEQRIEERTRELQIAEAALRQSQKMEAIGQLTGGIAHDFNNLLTGIIGSLDLIRRRITEGRVDGLDRFIDAAGSSAHRAASLTHRLLAFARRQPLDSKPVNIAILVRSMQDLLQRTLGEQVALEIYADSGLWLAQTDANQLESGLLNLCINARDAMPDGGKLTIETSNASLDYTDGHDDLTPGDYIAISVRDTGTGMAAEVLAKAFDPFFTTKPIGQGTGLGLSMVYGFAKQSGGSVRLSSEFGKGTTVKLLLPRCRGDTASEDEHKPEMAPHGRGETVLIVEDDPNVRMLVTELLDELGYKVLEAPDAKTAVLILDSHLPINLLISDVGLPGMNGRQLADMARATRPELRILFVTGYAEKAALRGSFLAPGMDMITKPFALDTLAAKIRNMILAGNE